MRSPSILRSILKDSDRMVERIVSIDPCGDGQNVYSWGEEVVRCRDCWYASSAGLDCDPEARYCVAMDTVMSPDGFCSFGERRDAR